MNPSSSSGEAIDDTSVDPSAESSSRSSTSREGKQALKKASVLAEEELEADRLLTSYEAGALIGVNPSSINNWVRAGRVPAFRTPGGHRRLRAEDLALYLKNNHMAVPYALRRLTYRRVVWVEARTSHRARLLQLAQQTEGLLIWVVPSLVEGMSLLGHVRPHLLAISAQDLDDGRMTVRALESMLRTEPTLSLTQTQVYTDDDDRPFEMWRSPFDDDQVLRVWLTGVTPKKPS